MAASQSLSLFNVILHWDIGSITHYKPNRYLLSLFDPFGVQPNKMIVDIVIHGDILCPWCFLQKKSLEEAMKRYQALHPEVEFDVIWKPFLLYPTLRKGIPSPSTI